MSRCRACDAILDESEIVWNEELQEHEDLCYICKKIVVETVDLLSSEDNLDDRLPEKE